MADKAYLMLKEAVLAKLDHSRELSDGELWGHIEAELKIQDKMRLLSFGERRQFVCFIP